MYGKLAIFNRWIVHWEVFVSGGLGVTLTRPIAVVDAEFRSFDELSDYSPNITFSIALGGRTYLTRWLAVFAELRLYGFPQPLEERLVRPDLGRPAGQPRHLAGRGRGVRGQRHGAGRAELLPAPDLRAPAAALGGTRGCDDC